ncbi:hypothetical protein SFA32_12260 [Buttiauxella sp. HR94]|nr:hypothetical protein SFA32_12260 [Buttiauxella sp. HR94]
MCKTFESIQSKIACAIQDARGETDIKLVVSLSDETPLDTYFCTKEHIPLSVFDSFSDRQIVKIYDGNQIDKVLNNFERSDDRKFKRLHNLPICLGCLFKTLDVLANHFPYIQVDIASL